MFAVSLVVALFAGVPATVAFADDTAVCVPSDTVTCPAAESTTTSTPAAADQPTQQTADPAPASTTPAPDQTAADTTTDTGAAIDNSVDSTAASGDATVAGNITAGSATTGDATAVVNQTNAVQTVSSLGGSGTKTFTANIDGDVNGDFVLDPNTILASTTGSTQSDPTLATTQVNASVQNDISADATSGNAVVAGNVQAGDATSGNATAVVNVMNLMNSIVASGQSFVGTININGNLNGDILLPANTLDQLLATNLPVSTAPSDSTITTTNTGTITNNVTSSATSGQATVDGNISAGNATTGSAGTNVTIFDLTNNQLAGSNVLLVFVNVQGQWVGLLYNAPAGSTAAAFGGDMTTATTLPGGGSLTSDTNLSIVNNINVSAHSGDASVTNNISAGNATSGRASTAVNILNLQNSSISLANWFGILFINVFGTWHGNFGLLADTPTGVSPADPTTGGGQQLTQTVAQTTPYRQFARFAAAATTGSSSDSAPSVPAQAVLSAATVDPVAHHVATPSISHGESHIDPVLLTAGVLLALLLLLLARRHTSREG